MTLLKRLISDLALALLFLTRLPVPYPKRAEEDTKEMSLHRLAAAVWAFPWVGLGIGLAIAACYGLGQAVSLPPLVSAVVAVTAGVWITGGLHEDGFADYCDSYGGFTREKRLAILRDSRLGSYGALGLGLSLCLKITALASLTPEAAFLWVTAVAMLARLGPVLLMYFLPPAKGEGLGAGVGRPALSLVLWSCGGGMVLCVGLAVLFDFWALCVLLPLCAFGLLGFGWQAWTRLGGQSGDVLGASVLVLEMLGFLCAAALM